MLSQPVYCIVHNIVCDRITQTLKIVFIFNFRMRSVSYRVITIS